MDIFSFGWGFLSAFIFSGLIVLFGLVFLGREPKTRVTDTIRFPVNNRTPLGPYIQEFIDLICSYFEVSESDIQNIGIKPGVPTNLNISLFLPQLVNYHDTIHRQNSTGQAMAKIRRTRRRNG